MCQDTGIATVFLKVGMNLRWDAKRSLSDVVNEGDQVKVKVLGVDERGKVRLSMKAVDQATGEDISKDRKSTRLNSSHT